MGYPLEFTGMYKTQMNVELGGVSLILYYNLVNMVVDLLGNFGYYGNTSYEYFCKSENMYCFSLSDLSIIIPNTPNNVVNDVSLTDQYDQLHLSVTSAYVEINAPVSHYKDNGCYSFNIVLGQHLSTNGRCFLCLTFQKTTRFCCRSNHISLIQWVRFETGKTQRISLPSVVVNPSR